MRKNPPQTPLLATLRALEPQQRREFATLAGTSVSYLYALGTCDRKGCRSPLAKGIADASCAMAAKYGSPVVTQDELATMCAV